MLHNEHFNQQVNILLDRFVDAIMDVYLRAGRQRIPKKATRRVRPVEEKKPVVLRAKPAPQMVAAPILPTNEDMPSWASALSEVSSQQSVQSRQRRSREELVDDTMRALTANPAGCTCDALADAIHLAASTLAPILDDLVANQMVRAQAADGVTLYRPPRIEPIRRTKPPPAP